MFNNARNFYTSVATSVQNYLRDTVVPTVTEFLDAASPEAVSIASEAEKANANNAPDTKDLAPAEAPLLKMLDTIVQDELPEPASPATDHS